MKKFLKFIIVSALIVTGSFALFKISSKYRVGILSDNIDCTIIAKGCNEARAISVDESGKIYIAYNDSIKEIDSEGKEKLLYKDKNLNIEDLVFIEEDLYFTSYDKVLSYSTKDGSVQTIVTDIPSSYKNRDRKLLAVGSELYLSIPSATNSGIAAKGEENDKYPLDVTLSGVNYGDEKTGAFMKNGVSTEQGQKVKGDKLGNSSIIKIDVDKKETKVFATGISNVAGFDINSNDEIFAIFSGMTETGERGINRDKDYIYPIEEEKWYGWPDFSGGDPIDSPRFKGEELVKPLLINPPSMIVPYPKYQHTRVGTMNELAFDKDGVVFNKDSSVFWESSEQMICNINSEGIVYRVLKLSDNSIVEDIVYNNEGFLILDSSIGCIYSLHEKEGWLGFKLPTVVWIFIFTLTIVLLCVVVMKITKNKQINK